MGLDREDSPISLGLWSYVKAFLKFYIKLFMAVLATKLLVGMERGGDKGTETVRRSGKEKMRQTR